MLKLRSKRSNHPLGVTIPRSEMISRSRSIPKKPLRVTPSLITETDTRATQALHSQKMFIKRSWTLSMSTLPTLFLLAKPEWQIGFFHPNLTQRNCEPTGYYHSLRDIYWGCTYIMIIYIVH